MKATLRAHGTKAHSEDRALTAFFAIPGALGTLSGGYGYARRVLAGFPIDGLALRTIALPPEFPFPDGTALDETAAILGGLPERAVVMIDGLALGAMPPEVLLRARGPLVALCHHPLALEAGLAPEDADRLRLSEATALRHARHTITTSEATARILTSAYDVPSAKITVAPPGTDPAPAAPGSGLPDCAILSVGSLTERKGHADLLRALADTGLTGWHLKIVGPTPDPHHLAMLRGLAADLGIADRVQFVGGLPPEDLALEYQRADLFVLASAYEGFGMAFTEAMAHGLPVIGLHCTAVAEATRGAATLVPKQELSATLSLMLSNSDARRDLATQCHEAAQSFTRWHETAAIIARVLRSVAS